MSNPVSVYPTSVAGPWENDSNVVGNDPNTFAQVHLKVEPPESFHLRRLWSFSDFGASYKAGAENHAVPFTRDSVRFTSFGQSNPTIELAKDKGLVFIMDVENDGEDDTPDLAIKFDASAFEEVSDNAVFDSVELDIFHDTSDGYVKLYTAKINWAV